MLNHILGGMQILLQPECIVALVVGVVVGIVIGILPGMGPSTGVALLIPITYSMSDSAALIIMVALYTAGVYGGSITATLCHTPGTAASAATAIDGYALTKMGRGTEAVGLATLSSVLGGAVGAIALICFSAPLGQLSLKFSALEYFVLAMFGVVMIGSLSGENMAKGLISGCFGLLMGCIGLDSITGYPRFTMGIMYLEDGIDYTNVLVGLFAVAQMLVLVEGIAKGQNSSLTAELSGRRLPHASALEKLIPTWARSSVLGALIGFVPAAGASIASWMNYGLTKNLSKHPEEFGKGSLEGIAASESANNAACGGAMIPLFTLGIPSSSCTAIMLGGLMIHGLVPGNSLFTTYADTTYSIFMGFLFSNILMGVFGFLLLRQFAKVSMVPNNVLVPIVIGISTISIFAIANSINDVYIMLLFGIIGYFMLKFGFSTAALVLGMVLSNTLEANFRRAQILAKGDLFGYFLTRPIAIVFVVLLVLDLAMGFFIFRITDLDLLTSLLCAAPGGMTDMPLIAMDMGADASMVAVMQFVRMVFGMGCLPSIILLASRMMGMDPPAPEQSAPIRGKKKSQASLVRALPTCGVALAGGIVGKLSGMPAGTLSFSLIAVIVMKLLADTPPMSLWVRRLAQVVSGCCIGAGIKKEQILQVGQMIVPAVALCLGYVLCCVVMGCVISRVFRMDLRGSMLSLSPAGATEMALIAADLGVPNSTNLVVLQICRLLGAVVVFPQIFALLIRSFG